ADLPEKFRRAVLHGTGSEAVEIRYDDGLRAYTTHKPFEGVIPNLERRWRETDSAWLREEMERFQGMAPCEACGGYRLKPEALCVKVAGRHIGEISELSILRARDWFGELGPKLGE